jgi:hypothetical protein
MFRLILPLFFTAAFLPRLAFPQVKSYHPAVTKMNGMTLAQLDNEFSNNSVPVTCALLTKHPWVLFAEHVPLSESFNMALVIPEQIASPSTYTIRFEGDCARESRLLNQYTNFRVRPFEKADRVRLFESPLFSEWQEFTLAPQYVQLDKRGSATFDPIRFLTMEGNKIKMDFGFPQISEDQDSDRFQVGVASIGQTVTLGPVNTRYFESDEQGTSQYLNAIWPLRISPSNPRNTSCRLVKPLSNNERPALMCREWERSGYAYFFLSSVCPIKGLAASKRSIFTQS